MLSVGGFPPFSAAANAISIPPGEYDRKVETQRNYFAAPHRELETNSFRATAYRRADIGMSYQLLDNSRREKKTFLKNVMLGVDCLNLFGIDNVNSYYWVTDVTSQQYAVPNYLELMRDCRRQCGGRRG